MSTSEETEDHDASVVRSTEPRIHHSLPEELSSPKATFACRYRRIVTEARVEGERRTLDTTALALAPILEVLTEREFGEWTGNTFAITRGAHE